MNETLAVVIIPLLPLLFGFLLVFGASLFDPEEHWILSVFAYLLALVSSFASMWWLGLGVGKYYAWAEMGDAIGTWTWISGIMVVVIVFYWIIFVFHRVINIAAQRKERRLEGG